LKKLTLVFAASLAASSPAFAQTIVGKASHYYLRTPTASGGRVGLLTAAHRTLPLGTKARVTNLKNHRSVVVTINDRGPFIRGRVIDVSTGAANLLGFRLAGLAPVKIETLR
jgi:rare lipoprotein A